MPINLLLYNQIVIDLFDYKFSGKNGNKAAKRQ